jgi:hypothetical protein
MCWTFVRESKPKARRAHTCDLCFLPISKGEVHVARVGRDSDSIFTFRMHTECEMVTRGWGEEEWDRDISSMEFLEELRNWKHGESM